MGRSMSALILLGLPAGAPRCCRRIRFARDGRDSRGDGERAARRQAPLASNPNDARAIGAGLRQPDRPGRPGRVISSAPSQRPRAPDASYFRTNRHAEGNPDPAIASNAWSRVPGARALAERPRPEEGGRAARRPAVRPTARFNVISKGRRSRRSLNASDGDRSYAGVGKSLRYPPESAIAILYTASSSATSRNLRRGRRRL